jgi:ParB-like chromosome segregation protein Spo0J
LPAQKNAWILRVSRRSDLSANVIESLKSSLVPLSNLRQYPGNPRRGDVDLIAESLAAYGQYRPIVVRRSDDTILAGNHTFQAAQKLGWQEVAVVYVDADDDRARRIVLADNRTSDLAYYNEEKLGDLLKSLSDPSNTGYDPRTIDRLISKHQSAEHFEEELNVINGHEITHNYDVTAVVSFGARTYYVKKDAFLDWQKLGITQEEFVERTRWPLAPEELPGEAEDLPADPSPVPAEKRMGPVSIDIGESVEIEDLSPVLKGVRNHSVAMVSESLRVNGQYRPIVINRRDNAVVVGYSIVEGARKLGWSSLQAVYIDVDSETATKIALIDNRTSDLAWYDDDELARLLQEVAGTNGTGFTDRDRKKLIDEIGLIDAADVEAPKVFAKVRFSPEEVFWAFAATREDHDSWLEDLQREARYSDEGIRRVLAARLGFPEEALERSQKR